MADRVYEMRVEVMCADDLDEGTWTCLSGILLGAIEQSDLQVTRFSMRQKWPGKSDE